MKPMVDRMPLFGAFMTMLIFSGCLYCARGAGAGVRIPARSILFRGHFDYLTCMYHVIIGIHPLINTKMLSPIDPPPLSPFFPSPPPSTLNRRIPTPTTTISTRWSTPNPSTKTEARIAYASPPPNPVPKPPAPTSTAHTSAVIPSIPPAPPPTEKNASTMAILTSPIPPIMRRDGRNGSRAERMATISRRSFGVLRERMMPMDSV